MVEDEAFQQVDGAVSERQVRVGFVGLVGPTNAGKSTLLNAVIGSKVSIVSPKSQTTRTKVVGIANTEDAQIVFVDTPGLVPQQHRNGLGKMLMSELNSSLVDLDLACVVLDIVKVERRDPGVQEFVSYLQARLDDRVKCMVLLNKIDLIPRKQILPVIAEVSQMFSSDRDLEFFPISARSREGIDAFLKVMSGKLPFGDRLYPEDYVSLQSEREFVAELVREKIYRCTHAEIPYCVAVHTESWSEQGGRLEVGVVIIVERDSLKPLLIGKGGQRLKQIGMLARQECERVFGVPVVLKTHVRVERKWTETQRGIEKVGYSLDSHSRGVR